MSSSRNDDFRKLRNMEFFDFDLFSASEVTFISESQTILTPVNNQRRKVEKSRTHCLQNGSSVAIGCYVFEWALKIMKFLSKHG